MLMRLSVSNYALIDEISINFGSGLNVLTGETGAGKSIIIGCVMLLMGARAQASEIRAGADAAYIEGVFTSPSTSAFKKKLAEYGLESDDNTIILSRQIRRNGNNTCRINNITVTLKVFHNIARDLINIYGQHDYQALIDEKQHLALLDALGNESFQLLKKDVQTCYRSAQQTGRALKRALKERQEKEERKAFIEAELEKLEAYQLKPGELSELTMQYDRQAYAKEMQESLSESQYQLYAMEDSIYNLLSRVWRNLESLPVQDEEIEDYAKRAESLTIGVSELAHDLNDAAHHYTYDPETFAKAQDRLNILQALEREYHLSIDDLMAKIEAYQAELDTIFHLDDDLSVLKKAYKTEKSKYDEKAQALSQRRQDLAAEIRTKLLAELKDLDMIHADFKVDFKKSAGTSEGIDDVRFLLRTNPGSDLRPLTDIASGGEMSRIMLAFKSILRTMSDVDTLIFDEIDTGIGGIVLGKVAEKLHALSEYQQVICVTHAAAIAARAEHHFFIKKAVENDSTTTSVYPLASADEMINELARMLGGHEQWHYDSAKALKYGK